MHAHTCPGVVDDKWNISISAAIALLLLWFNDTRVWDPNRVADFIVGVIAIRLRISNTRMSNICLQGELEALQPGAA
jgi:hypothetical protein